MVKILLLHVNDARLIGWSEYVRVDLLKTISAIMPKSLFGCCGVAAATTSHMLMAHNSPGCLKIFERQNLLATLLGK